MAVPGRGRQNTPVPLACTPLLDTEILKLEVPESVLPLRFLLGWRLLIRLLLVVT